MAKCAYCEEKLKSPDRCDACAKGQPVNLEREIAEAKQSRAKAAKTAKPKTTKAAKVPPSQSSTYNFPGGNAVIAGAVLVLIGAVVPFVAALGLILVFVGFAEFATKVWQKLEE